MKATRRHIVVVVLVIVVNSGLAMPVAAQSLNNPSPEAVAVSLKELAQRVLTLIETLFKPNDDRSPQPAPVDHLGPDLDPNG